MMSEGIKIKNICTKTEICFCNDLALMIKQYVVKNTQKVNSFSIIKMLNVVKRNDCTCIWLKI